MKYTVIHFHCICNNQRRDNTPNTSPVPRLPHFSATIQIDTERESFEQANKLTANPSEPMIFCFSTITPTISLSSETTGVSEEAGDGELERDTDNSF